MCFSAEASFAGAAVLGALGWASGRLPLPRVLIWVALIPLLFASQQFSEGLVWLGVTGKVSENGLIRLAPYIYLFFAFLVWPIWIPFALYKAEKEIGRKRVLLVLGVMGTCLSLYYISHFPHLHLKVQIAGHSLRYFGTEMPAYVWIYLLATLVPSFVSSLRGMWAFGLLMTVCFGISFLFYKYALTSVWCFLSAICSVSLYFILRDTQTAAERSPLR